MPWRFTFTTDNVERCPRCKGDGGTSYDVEVNNGRGELITQNRHTPCPACNGVRVIVKGSYKRVWVPRVKQQCWRCGGNGAIIEKEVASRYIQSGEPASWKNVKKTCPSCDGAGYLYTFGNYYRETATPAPWATYSHKEYSKTEEEFAPQGCILGLIIAAILAYLYYVKVIL